MTTADNSFDSNSSAVSDVRDESLALVEIGVQSVILLIAIVSNSLVLFALCCQGRFRSRIYLFMFHLSVADLLVAVLSLLPQLVWDVTFRFRGGDLLCRAVKYLQVMVLYLSTYILVMMAVDRCRAVCWTVTGQWNSIKVAKSMIAGAWALSIAAALPQVVIFKKMEIRPGVEDCWANFDQPWTEKLYVVWFVVSIFILPLVVISCCYGFICYTLWIYDKRRIDRRNADLIALRALDDGKTKSNASPSRSPEGSGSGPAGLGISEAKVKSLKLTLLVVICFFVCWAPFCVTQLVVTFNPPPAASSLEVILLLLASLNSCTNPWIYVAFSGSLLTQLSTCLGLRVGRDRNLASIADEDYEEKPPNSEHHVPSTKCEMV